MVGERGGVLYRIGCLPFETADVGDKTRRGRIGTAILGGLLGTEPAASYSTRRLLGLLRPLLCCSRRVSRGYSSLCAARGCVCSKSRCSSGMAGMGLRGPVIRGDELIGFQRLAGESCEDCLVLRKSDLRAIRFGKGRSPDESGNGCRGSLFACSTDGESISTWPCGVVNGRWLLKLEDAVFLELMMSRC